MMFEPDFKDEFVELSTQITAEETEIGANELLLIHEAAKLIGQASTPGVAITGILRLLSQMLGLNRGRVVLPSEDPSILQMRYSYGITEDQRRRGSYKLGEGITGRVMQSRTYEVVQNIDDDQNYLYRAIDRETLPDGVVAFVAVPIMDGSTSIGVLACHRLRMRMRPFQADVLVLKIVATLIAQVLKIHSLIENETEELERENRSLRDALSSSVNGEGLVGESAQLKAAITQALRVADTPVTVLITGESGTGKDRIAQLLHLKSHRKDRPFVAVNCAAIPENLIESELFGHEKGSFTGASSQKLGKLELANHGTLFLDEIGDLSMDLQSKLLRVLEDQSIVRVGGTTPVPIDVRIVAATHKNLKEKVNRSEFRLDLFYRLNVFPLELPPLRDRGQDIEQLARHFLFKANREYDRHASFLPGVLERLASYDWPGNIRQLENVIKRSVLIATHGKINPQDMEVILYQESAIFRESSTSVPDQPAPAGFFADQTGGQQSGSLPSFQSAPQQYERGYRWVSEDESEQLIQALRDTGGNKTRAAALLGMTARQFRYRIKKLNLTSAC